VRSHLDRAWRFAGTAVAFPLLFGGASVVAAVVFPILQAVTADRPLRRERNQNLVHVLFHLYIGLLRALRLIDVEIEGRERLSSGPARIIVANHPSLLDVVLLMALVRRAQCVVKHELWQSPYLGRMVRGAGYIRNDLDSAALLEACQAALATGNHLIIFPEGTRSVPGEPIRFRRGFANIATSLGAEIQPVTVSCSPPTLTKGERWWVIPKRRPRFRIEIGEPLSTHSWLISEHRPMAARKIVRHFEEYYAGRLARGQP
jgi:1-acyl-sn-glycerol-3-phosphate acyltransferase